jgi:hypothetical protein
LDFSTFVITGPSTNTLSTAKQFGGSQMMGDAAGVLASPATNCLTDTFSVTGSPGGNPPTICGTNTGYHSKYYNQLIFWYEGKTYFSIDKNSF